MKGIMIPGTDPAKDKKYIENFKMIIRIEREKRFNLFNPLRVGDTYLHN